MTRTFSSSSGNLQSIFECKYDSEPCKMRLWASPLLCEDHVVGRGKVPYILSKIECIVKFPQPNTNFATVVAPMTELFKKGHKCVLSGDCEKLFQLHVVYISGIAQPFKLAVDTSNLASDAV